MPELYDYQKKYLKDLPKNVIMTADVGLGKTPMALRHFEKHSMRHPRWNMLVVVAPASKIRSGDWQNDIREWLPDLHLRVTGTGIYCISYEEFTKQADLRTKKTNDFSSICFIFDEIHYVKNPMSKRSKAFVEVTRTAHQWIGLSATPMSNGWHDAANYAIATGLVKNKTEFYRLFVVTVMKVMGSRHFPMITGYQHVEKLQEWWGKISKPLSREGNLDLPKFIDKWVKIEMPSDVRKEQHRIVSERTLDGEMLDSHMKVLAALRKNLVSTRADAIRNILDKTDENIVIFYELNAERDLVKKILAEKEYSDRTLFEQNGHVKTLPTADAPKPKKKAVLLIQYRSGAAGLNLQYASVTVFMSPTYSYQDYHQARGRTDRNGQTKTPVFYHLQTQSAPIDSKVWEALKAKRDFSEKNVDISDLSD